MDNEALRSIKYSQTEGIKIDKIALKLGRSKRLVFLQMIEYFYRTKKDPLDISDDLLKNTMVRQHKDYIGFIKTQENELLIPARREIDRLSESHKKVINGFNGLLKQNEAIPLLIDKQNKFLFQLEAHYKSIVLGIQAKEQLKKLFLHVFDGYTAARDHIPAIGSRKEKEQLTLTTRNQIILL